MKTPEINTDADMALSAKLSRTLEKIDKVQDNTTEHKQDQTNPHQVTKEQVGLGNVDNTADIDKPVSLAGRTAISEALQEAESYTDKKNLEHISACKTYTDIKAIETVSACKTYTDIKAIETVSACKTYTDIKAIETVSACKTYTDIKAIETVSACKTFTTGRLAEKSPLTHTHGLESEAIVGLLPIDKGGTGAKTAEEARKALGILQVGHAPLVPQQASWVTLGPFAPGVWFYLPQGGVWAYIFVKWDVSGSFHYIWGGVGPGGSEVGRSIPQTVGGVAWRIA